MVWMGICQSFSGDEIMSFNNFPMPEGLTLEDYRDWLRRGKPGLPKVIRILGEAIEGKQKQLARTSLAGMSMGVPTGEGK